jgi:hypothetical protein
VWRFTPELTTAEPLLCQDQFYRSRKIVAFHPLSAGGAIDFVYVEDITQLQYENEFSNFQNYLVFLFGANQAGLTIVGPNGPDTLRFNSSSP